MTALRTVAAVIAGHIAIAAFFFFKPTPHYFMVTCFSTVFVWSAAFAVKRFRTVAIVATSLIQIIVHHLAYPLWQAELASFWWPFAQFAALQYIIIQALSSRDTIGPAKSS